jgi:hypothetical protein
VHRLLRIEPMKDLIHMSKNEWIAFLLFNILDHILHHLFVFANRLEKSFQNLLAKSQRCRNKSARSIFKI